jgi:hypothetical protein
MKFTLIKDQVNINFAGLDHRRLNWRVNSKVLPLTSLDPEKNLREFLFYQDLNSPDFYYVSNCPTKDFIV